MLPVELSQIRVFPVTDFIHPKSYSGSRMGNDSCKAIVQRYARTISRYRDLARIFHGTGSSLEFLLAPWLLWAIREF